MNFLWRSEEVFTSKFPLFWGFGCSTYLLWKVSFAGVGEAELQENGWSLFLPFSMAARSSGRPQGSSRLTLQSLVIHLEVLVSYSRAWHIPSLPPWCPAGFLPLQQHIFCRSGAIPPLAGAVCQPLWELLLRSWRHTSFEVKIWLGIAPPSSYSLETRLQQGSLWVPARRWGYESVSQSEQARIIKHSKLVQKFKRCSAVLI